MIKINPITSNFTSGELSKDMLGRADVERFFNGAEIIENFAIHPTGGLYRRLGTKKITNTDCPNSRLIEFSRSRQEAIVLELGCGKIQFIQPTGYLPQSINCSVLAGNGGQGIRTYEVDLTPDIGDVYLTFHGSEIPNRYVVSWNGSAVIDTGYAGSDEYDTLLEDLDLDPVERPSSGQLMFTKTLSGPATATVTIYSPLPGSGWDFQLSCPGSEPPDDPTPPEPPPFPDHTTITFTELGTDFYLLSAPLSTVFLSYTVITVKLTTDGEIAPFNLFISATAESNVLGTPYFITYLTADDEVATGYAIRQEIAP